MQSSSFNCSLLGAKWDIYLKGYSNCADFSSSTRSSGDIFITDWSRVPSPHNLVHFKLA